MLPRRISGNIAASSVWIHSISHFYFVPSCFRNGMVIFTFPACCSGHGLPAVSLRLGNCGFLFFLISYVSGSSSKSTAVTRNRKCIWGTTQKTLFFPIWPCFFILLYGLSSVVSFYSGNPTVLFFLYFLKNNSHNKINHLKAYNSVTFSTFTVLCNHHLCLVPNIFIPTRDDPILMKKSLPILTSPQPLTNVNLLP